MKFQKRGQVTVFIIVGVIILFVIGLFLFLRREKVTSELAPLELQLEEVPIEFRPVNSLIEECLYQTAKEGIIKLGERGGFVDLVGHGIVTKSDAINSDAVKLQSSADFSTAYWWYLSSDNLCGNNCQVTAIPENKLFLTKGTNQRSSIEGQLEEYIKQNLRTCLNNFEVLTNQGFLIQEKGEIFPTITVTQNDIIAQLEYELEAKKISTADLKRFFVRLPVNLMKIYDIANTITEMQAQYHILEKHTLNIIEAYQGINKNKLPPFSKQKVQIGGEVTWQQSEVKTLLEQALTSNVQLLQVYGTRNYAPYAFPGNALYDSLYNKGMLVQGSDEWSDLDVNFWYLPWFGLYLNLNCCGETCKPESITSHLHFNFGLQSYSFVYDISYPVAVEIYDPYAFNNQGYRFMFFLETNIRANEPIQSNYEHLDAIYLEKTMLCDDDKRTSGNITINIKDELTAQPLNDVQVAFSSYDENCLIGTATNGTYTGKFPVMLGGTVTFIKDSYIAHTQRFDTKLNKNDELSVSLKPILTKNLIVKKRVMNKSGVAWVLTNTVADLKNNEQAIVLLQKKENLQERDHSSSVSIIGNTPAQIDVAPATYDITISLIYQDSIIIPASVREYNDKKFTIDEFENSLAGGASYNYTFTKEDLEKDNITLYVLNPDIASIPESQRVIEDLDIFFELEELSERNKRTTLKPRFE